jgi:hypothetical protein
MRLARHAARMSYVLNACNILVGKHEGKRQRESPKCIWNNIKMGLREIGSEILQGFHLVQGMNQWRVLVNTVMNEF